MLLVSLEIRSRQRKELLLERGRSRAKSVEEISDSIHVEKWRKRCLEDGLSADSGLFQHGTFYHDKNCPQLTSRSMSPYNFFTRY